MPCLRIVALLVLLAAMQACGTSVSTSPSEWTTLQPAGLEEASLSIRTLAVSGAGQRLAWSANSDGGKETHAYVGIVDLPSKKTTFHMKVDAHVADVAIDVGGRRIFIAGRGVRCLDDTGKTIWEAAPAVEFNQLVGPFDGTLVAETDRQVALVNAATGAIDTAFDCDDAKCVFGNLMPSPDGATVLVWKRKANVQMTDAPDYVTAYLLDARTLARKSTISFADLKCLTRPEAVSVNGDLLICQEDFDRLNIVQVSTKKTTPLDAHMSGIVGGPTPVFSSDGTRAMVPCSERGFNKDVFSILFFDTATGKILASMETLPEHLSIRCSVINVQKNIAVLALNNYRDGSVPSVLVWCAAGAWPGQWRVARQWCASCICQATDSG